MKHNWYILVLDRNYFNQAEETLTAKKNVEQEFC